MTTAEPWVSMEDVVNEAIEEFSAHIDNGHLMAKSRTFEKRQGDPVPGNGVFVFDCLAGRLP